MAFPNMGDAAPRFLLYHLQPISARLLFMRHESGSVLAPTPLPFLTSPIEDESGAGGIDLNQQLALGLQVNAELGFDPGMLVVDPTFLRRAAIPHAEVDIYLARFSTHDPPHADVRAKGGDLRLLTELRGGHPVEMAMLRWAYEYLLSD